MKPFGINGHIAGAGNLNIVRNISAANRVGKTDISLVGDPATPIERKAGAGNIYPDAAFG